VFYIKNKFDNRKAFTVFELLISILIIISFSSAFLFSYSEFRESASLKKIRTELPSFIYTAADISYNKEERLDLKIDFKSKLIFVKKDDNILMNFKLPACFEYEDAYGNKTLERNTTETGNINSSFSIYSFDKKGNAIFKQTFLNNSKYIKYVIINQYIPKCSIVDGEHTIFANWEKLE
jgi:hypothetical protein